jgi:hypothetical protein
MFYIAQLWYWNAGNIICDYSAALVLERERERKRERIFGPIRIPIL